MKRSLYARLAAGNIRKNRRLYLPYLLSGGAMTAIFFILAYLSQDPSILQMPGGASLSMLLAFGEFVMALFCAIFLFYTSSFLIKQRSRELGLYSMLGMNRAHVTRIVLLETFDCFFLSVLGGLLSGILLAKAFQLGLLRLTHTAVSAELSLPPRLFLITVAVFGVIYAAIALRSAVHVLRCKPLELMHSSRQGEKPPRGNALLALLGLASLFAGYALAVSVASPLDAFTLFFVAVLLVILGTTLCFTTGSVTLLRLLSASKRYYYKPAHFISVSGMRYRMRRNGSSLSSICILSTMVLVTLSAVTCLYVGSEDSLRARYPHEIQFTLSTRELPEQDALRAPIEQALSDCSIRPENVCGVRTLAFYGAFQSGVLNTNVSAAHVASPSGFIILPLADYNAAGGTAYTLEDGEALAAGPLLARLDGSIALSPELVYTFAETDVALPFSSDDFSSIEYLVLVVPDEDAFEAINRFQQQAYGKEASDVETSYAFDTALEPHAQVELMHRLDASLQMPGLRIRGEAREEMRADFIASYVGFLFLGAMLSLAFTCSAVLSMYYKQITEGYEDQQSFAIMRRVGLSRELIKKSVSSQVLTVFFLPLMTAGLHTAFAFPMISKLLMPFGLFNTRLLALTTLATFGGFVVLYVVCYLMTSRTYYRLVSSASYP